MERYFRVKEMEFYAIIRQHLYIFGGGPDVFRF